ncbi:MAG TPA: sulfite exporter TauE/SafE family protein [Chitinophagaceae bacterium]|nr:sulfite exporter TauE/SafE family protein [Chitinophagaceae bacterium]
MKHHKLANMNAETILILIGVGLVAGTLSGLVGVGGGIIIVPALVFFLGFSQQAAQGTSLGLLLLPAGILAVINYYKQGFIDLKVVGIMCAAFVFGGWLGSKLALSLPQEVVKKVFAVVLFYAAFKMMGWDEVIFKWLKGLF